MIQNLKNKPLEVFKNFKSLFDDKIGFYFVLFLILFGSFIFIDRCKRTNEVMANKAFAKGFITDCSSAIRPIRIDLKYEFWVDGKKIVSSSSSQDFSNCNRIDSKYYLIVYSSKNPKLNRLLLTRSERFDYGLSDEDFIKIMK